MFNPFNPVSGLTSLLWYWTRDSLVTYLKCIIINKIIKGSRCYQAIILCAKEWHLTVTASNDLSLHVQVLEENSDQKSYHLQHDMRLSVNT